MTENSRKSIKKYWYNDDVVRSAAFNASSIIVPILERFIMKAVEEAHSSVTDDDLKKDVQVLLHEEEAHSGVHDKYNEILKEKGYSFSAIHKFESWFLGLFEGSDIKTRLALCLCGEYFTALLSKHTLEEGVLVEAGNIDERMRRVWIWHALEELHHRSVTFDLYEHIGGGYIRRSLVMFVSSFLFLSVHTWCFLSLLRQDKKLSDWDVLKNSASFFLGRKGYYSSTFLHWFSFFSTSFHPSKLPIKERLSEGLHHYHVEDELIASLRKAT